MTTPRTSSRLDAGAHVGRRVLVTVSGVPLQVPAADDGALVHLQFRRFAGCPVCNLHLRSVVQRHAEIEAAGVREVVLFHSPADELVENVRDLPFAVVADPGKLLYREFGVQPAPRALLHPRAWLPILRAVARALWRSVRHREPLPSLSPSGGRWGLPADFLIDSGGRVVACKYGTFVYDQWSVDEVLDLARTARTSEVASADS